MKTFYRFLTIGMLLFLLVGCENPFFTRTELSGQVINTNGDGVKAKLTITGNVMLPPVETDDSGFFAITIDLQEMGKSVAVKILSGAEDQVQPFLVELNRAKKYVIFKLEDTKQTLIHGIVTNSSTGAPLQQVSVRVGTGNNYFAETDSEGFYSLNVYTSKSQNSVSVNFSKPGFRSKSLTANTSGPDYELNVSLEPEI